MTRYLNYFHPYKRKPAYHEDQLTRAFMVLLRHVPIAHAAWLGLVDRAHRRNGGAGIPMLPELPAPMFDIQRSGLPEDVSRVISVLQSGDPFEDDRHVGASDRGQVLDGIVCYPPDMAIVVENKPDVGNVWFEQLSIQVPEETEVDPTFASLPWRDVIEVLGNLVTAEHVNVAEMNLIEDFLDFVETHFPRLQPFNRLGLCKRDAYRLERRCRQILEELARGHVHYHSGWAWYIELSRTDAARMVALAPHKKNDSFEMVAMIAPGDIMSQARVLYRRIGPETVDQLEAAGWDVEPNFHLSHVAKNLVWTSTSLSTREYVAYWCERVAEIRQIQREEFAQYFEWLVSEGLADEGDRPEFDKHLLETRRSSMNVCPGLSVTRAWSLETAARLDDSGEFVPTLRRVTEKALGTWGSALPSVEEAVSLVPHDG